jgi:hypothetical protein
LISYGQFYITILLYYVRGKPARIQAQEYKPTWDCPRLDGIALLIRAAVIPYPCRRDAGDPRLLKELVLFELQVSIEACRKGDDSKRLLFWAPD